MLEYIAEPFNKRPKSRFLQQKVDVYCGVSFIYSAYFNKVW